MVEVITKTIQLHRVQHQFRHSNAVFRAFCGGRGAGKSFVGAYDLIRRARRGCTYMIVGPTYTTLRDSSMRTFLSLCRELGVLDPSQMRSSAPPQMTLSTGAEILFRSADDPEKLRGPNLSGVWLDEASLMPRVAYDICIASLREHGRQGFLSATFTPKGPTHWTHELWGGTRPDTVLFRAPTAANPFLPDDFHDKLKQQFGDTQFARQELGGEFVQMEGAEFPAEWFGWPGFWLDEFPDTYAARAVYLDPSKGVSARETGSVKKAGDYQAICRAQLCVVEGRNTFVLDADLNREPVTAMVARAVRTVRDWRGVTKCAFEENSTMGFIDPEFARQMTELRVAQPWQAVTNTVPKLQRIRRVGAYLSRKMVRILNTPGGRLLRAQLGDVPLGQFDDAADAAAGAIALLGG